LVAGKYEQLWHKICHYHKQHQMLIWTTPLRRACRDDRNGYIICLLWSSGAQDITCLIYYGMLTSSRRQTPHLTTHGPNTRVTHKPLSPHRPHRATARPSRVSAWRTNFLFDTCASQAIAAHVANVPSSPCLVGKRKNFLSF
jgi:hypothetical protein